MLNTRRRLVAVAISTIAVSALAFAACGDDAKPAATAAATTSGTRAAAGATTAAAAASTAGLTATVHIADNSFTPTVKIKAGGKVTWDWTGSSNPHSVAGTSDNAKTLLKSPQNSGGKGSYEVTFAAPGTYKYQCGVHGASMSGEVVVE